MKALEKTKVDIIEFGDQPEDVFYCLVDLTISPNGLNVDKLKISDPRNFDQRLMESGCLMMFSGDEIEELVSRGDVSRDELHQSLVNLAIKEGVIKKS
ncbi:MAG: hypothetical protein WD381_02480 [Balneolaceae bacterium]